MTIFSISELDSGSAVFDVRGDVIKFEFGDSEILASLGNSPLPFISQYNSTSG